MSMRLLWVVLPLLLLFNLPTAPVTHAHNEQSELSASDSLIAPTPSVSLSNTLPGLSEYMAGDIAVRLILAESNGQIDPSTENWTSAQIQDIQQQTEEALNWWAAQLPLAKIRFQLQVEVLPTAYEPINYGLAEEGRWIGDLMRQRGFTEKSYFDQVYAAGEALRAERKADWATTIFMVNSAQNLSGMFEDKRFAYAYINGPFMVITSDVGSYGSQHLRAILAHELGHLFGALDQYAAAETPCNKQSGYLQAPTSNSEFNNCGKNEPSIMLSPLSAFEHKHIDSSALAQVGYRDSDTDGVIDPLDTKPTLTLEPTIAASPQRPMLRGVGQDLGFPAAQQSVSLNHIVGVEYRINGGVWQAAEASDGHFDSSAEAFFSELPLYNGTHTIEVRAINTLGIASEIEELHLTISWIGEQPIYTPSTTKLSNNRQIQIELHAPASTRSVQISERPDFAEALWQPYSPTMPFQLSKEDGQKTLYLRFRDAAGYISQAYGLVVRLDTRAPTGQIMLDSQDRSRLLITAEDVGSGIQEMALQIGDAAPLWMPFEDMIELTAVPGLSADLSNTPMSVLLRDAAGNTSAPYVVNTSYSLYLPFIMR